VAQGLTDSMAQSPLSNDEIKTWTKLNLNDEQFGLPESLSR